MTPNSATAFAHEADRLYSDSGSDNPVVWIQEPISRQIFSKGTLINNLYVQVMSAFDAVSASDEIAREFAAWDAASDEALLNFEKENL
jgi:hypothetical protein